MLSLIMGKQRSGKSFYVTSLHLEYLTSSDYSVVTNCAIKRDFLIDLACSKTSEERRGEFEKRLIILTHEQSIWFWKYKPAHSVVFLDECYEIFPAQSAMDPIKDREKRVERFEDLMSYIRQHGHFKDEIYLISHDPQDLNTFIKRGVMRVYHVRNSLDVNIFKMRILQGLKWPKQFFFVYMYDNIKTALREVDCIGDFRVFPKQEIFDCYDSFNVSSKLAEMEKAGDDKKSENFDKPYSEVLKEYFKQQKALIIILITTVFFILFVGQQLYVNFQQKLKTKSTMTVLNNKRKAKEKKEEIQLEEKEKIDESWKSVLVGKIKYKSLNTIITQSHTFNINAIYKDYKIVYEKGKICLSNQQSKRKFYFSSSQFSAVPLHFLLTKEEIESKGEIVTQRSKGSYKLVKN